MIEWGEDLSFTYALEMYPKLRGLMLDSLCFILNVIVDKFLNKCRFRFTIQNLLILFSNLFFYQLKYS